MPNYYTKNANFEKFKLAEKNLYILNDNVILEMFIKSSYT